MTVTSELDLVSHSRLHLSQTAGKLGMGNKRNGKWNYLFWAINQSHFSLSKMSQCSHRVLTENKADVTAEVTPQVTQKHTEVTQDVTLLRCMKLPSPQRNTQSPNRHPPQNFGKRENKQIQQTVESLKQQCSAKWLSFYFSIGLSTFVM